MTDYISRDEAYPLAKKICDTVNSGEYSPVVMPYKILDWIDDIPAADVVEVVRCKDCVYWKSWGNTEHHLCAYVASAKFIRRADDFCSRGAKMEVEQT